MKPATRVTLAVSLLLAISTHSNAANAAERRRETLSTASALGQDLPPAEEVSLDSLDPLADLIRSRQIEVEAGRRLKLDRRIIAVPPLSAEDRIYDVGGEESEAWFRTRDAASKQLDREDLATDSDGMRIALTEWLTCLVEITVPIDRDRSAIEIGEADPMNELRVFGGLATAF
jgi:hypothetical protein